MRVVGFVFIVSILSGVPLLIVVGIMRKWFSSLGSTGFYFFERKENGILWLIKGSKFVGFLENHYTFIIGKMLVVNFWEYCSFFIDWLFFCLNCDCFYRCHHHFLPIFPPVFDLLLFWPDTDFFSSFDILDVPSVGDFLLDPSFLLLHFHFSFSSYVCFLYSHWEIF